MTLPGHLTADWPAPANIRTLFTTRTGGISSGDFGSFNLGLQVGDEASAVNVNRERLRHTVGGELAFLSQVHGTDCVRLPRLSSASPLVADAAWTTAVGCVCTVLVADCLPVFLARRDGSAVGIAHAGWKGLAQGVLPNIVAAMSEGRSAHELVAWLGPCIGPDAFEVGPDVRGAFLARDAGAGHAFLAKPNGKWLGSLPALARRSLNTAGVTAVFGGGACTYSDAERFFSHRRATHAGARTGRMAGLIWRDA